MSYSVYLPNYSIGEDCYKELPYVARNYGKKAVVIGGKTAMAKSKDALLEGIKGSDLEITDFIWYGGDSSYENGNALIANPAVREADIIFGVGGDVKQEDIKAKFENGILSLSVPKPVEQKKVETSKRIAIEG